MKQRIDFINTGLLLILIGVTAVFINQLVKDSYFDKRDWNMVVNADVKQTKAVQIVSARFWNDKHESDYQELGQYEALSIITEKKDFFIGFDAYDTEKSLYPNTFQGEWFSFADKTFYHFKGNVPQEKIKIFAKKAKSIASQEVTFCATLLPKGKVVISVGTLIESEDYPKKYKLIPIDTLQGNIVQSDWKILKSTVSRLGNVTNLDDYVHIITQKHNWFFILAMPENAQVYGLFIDAFSDEVINAPDYDNIMQPENRLLPSKFQLQWKTTENESFRTDWRFNGDELLSAFKKLEALSPNEPIKIFFVRDDDVTKYQLSVSNSKETIPLKNAIESEVISMD